jgi:hypothetical protein
VNDDQRPSADSHAVADEVLIPGPALEDVEARRGELSAAESMSSDPAFGTHPMSPMGQFDATTNWLQAGLRAGGWRRKAVKAYVLAPILVLVLAILINVVD